MAKRPGKQIKGNQNSVQKPAVVKEQTSLNGPFRPTVHAVIVSCIAIITWSFLQVSLGDDNNLWDDTPYLRDNWLVKSTSWEGIKHIFANPSMGNYHPLTILSYAIEYSYVHLAPWLYHFDNLLIHIITVMLVYWLVQLLTRRTIAAIVAALLFGLHPMHVESVAWVASRKDVLCGAFYVATCIAYIYYTRAANSKWIFYAAALALFTCSLLSKAVSVTLPLCLLLLDYWENRPIGKKELIEKVPFFLLSLVLGVIAIRVQHTAGAMEMNKISFNPIERVALSAYAFITYLWKAIVPVHLHCLYPYPAKVNGALPFVYYIYPALAAALIFLIWRYAKSNKVILFGFIFFFANIVLLLQLLPVGDAIIAERYTYIPYLGLFIIAGYYVSVCFDAGVSKTLRYTVPAVAFIYLGVLGYTSQERCLVWHDELSLWRDEAEKEPVRGVRGFNNLGYLYYTKWLAAADTADKKNFYDSAAFFMNKAIATQPDFVNPYLALGDLQRSAGQYEQAKRTYFTAISRIPSESNLYFGLAIVYYVTKVMDSSGFYFRKVLQIAPSSAAYGNYANYLTAVGKDDSALIEFNQSVLLAKNDYVPYMNRGNLYRKMNKWDGARQDYESALKINPDLGQLYYLRSFCDTQSKNNAAAIADIEKAISLGYNNVDQAYYNSVKNK